MTSRHQITEIPEVDLLEDFYSEKPLSEGEMKEVSKALEKKVKTNRKNVFKILSHLKALKNYMLDKDVKWTRKSVVVAALLYFIAPLDVIPDFAPFVGFLDDIGVIAWTVRYLGREISNYYD
ncbi:MAG TPA: YkvA family protein [Ignavibacteria bacterium]|jgi:uncharacterized membrane protein YkvA (DUF1232 family)